MYFPALHTKILVVKKPDLNFLRQGVDRYNNIGKKKGDLAVMNVPAGEVKFKILEID